MFTLKIYGDVSLEITQLIWNYGCLNLPLFFLFRPRLVSAMRGICGTIQKLSAWYKALWGIIIGLFTYLSNLVTNFMKEFKSLERMNFV